jgi:pantoate kinase
MPEPDPERPSFSAYLSVWFAEQPVLSGLAVSVVLALALAGCWAGMLSVSLAALVVAFVVQVLLGWALFTGVALRRRRHEGGPKR